MFNRFVILAILLAGASAHAASPKHGWAGSEIAAINGSNASWSYNWWHVKPEGIANSNAEWVPLIKFYNGNFQNNLNTIASYNDVSTLLVFNEPERVDQSNVSVADALAAWPLVQQTLPQLKLVSPAVSDTADGRDWLDSFFATVDSRNSNANPADDLRVDAVAFHWYGGSTPNNPVATANSFLSRVDYYYNRYNRPIWIKEFAIHDWAGNYTDAEIAEANRIFLEVAMAGLESRSFVEKYAYYQHFSDATALSGNPITPTSIGDVYVDTLMPGETRNLNGVSLGTDVTYLRGGTVTNTGAALDLAMRAIDSLEGVGTIGGTADWAVGGGKGGSFVRIRSGGALVKQGDNTVTFSNVSTIKAGDLIIADGQVKITDGSVSGAGVLRVQQGAALELIAAGGRGTYTLSNQQVELGGELIGPVIVNSGSTLTTVGSAARVQSNLTLNSATLIVGGAGFNEQVPQTTHVTTGLNLNFDASLDLPADTQWSSSVGAQSLAFASAASPVVVQSAAFPGISAAYSIPASGGASGLNGYFDLGGPRNRQDATFELVFRVGGQNAGADQVLFEAGGLNQGVAFVLNGNQLKFNVDGDGEDIDITQTLSNGWHQAVGVIDLQSGGDVVSLYVNGQLVSTLTDQNVVRWAGGNVSGLGAGANSVTGVSSGTGIPYHADIAIARYYQNSAFDASQVMQNYQAITLAPAPAASEFEVTGALVLGTGTVARLDIGDAGAADKIVVGQNLAFNGGSIEVAYVGVEGLAAGDMFDLLDSASASGVPSALVLPTLSGGLMWRTGNLMSSGVISVAIAGDYNGDGAVDASDYTVWRDQLGATLLTNADGNNDGVVNTLDLAVWKNQFGQAASAVIGALAGAVPEPSAAVLIFVAMTAIAVRRRAQRSKRQSRAIATSP